MNPWYCGAAGTLELPYGTYKTDRKANVVLLLKGLFFLVHKHIFHETGRMPADGMSIARGLTLDNIIEGFSCDQVPMDILTIAFRQLKSLLSEFGLLCEPIFNNVSYNAGFVSEFVDLYYAIPRFMSISRYKRKTPTWIIDPAAGKDKLVALFDCINSSGVVFDGDVDFEKFSRALNGDDGVCVRLASNSAFAFLMGKLSERGIVSSQWESAVGKSHNFLSSSTGRAMTASSLSSLYSEYRDIDTPPFSSIAEWIKAVTPHAI